VSLGGLGDDWATAATEDSTIATTIGNTAQDRAERALWRVWLPTLLAAAAAATAVTAVRIGRTSSTNEERQHPNDEDNHDATARSDEIGVA
jgi:high-affinity iron transporter